MNNSRSSLAFSKAFTLIELSISMGLLAVVGGVIYTVLNGGMVLFSKNVATNYSNLSVQSSSQRMIRDLHESIGRAELVGLDLQPVTTSASPAVRFPRLLNSAATLIISNTAGSKVINSVSPTSNVSLYIPQQPIAPQVGDILIFPDINDLSGNTLTRKITAVTLGNPTSITTKDLGINLNLDTSTPADPTLVYIARLAAYAVVTTATEISGLPSRTEVRFYADASNLSNYVVINNNLTTFLPPLASGDYVSPYGSGAVAVPAGPFSINTTSASDPGNSVRIQLISINADTGKRAFVGDRMVLSQIIPPKCLILQSTNYN